MGRYTVERRCSHNPVTEAGECLLAERAAMEAQHAVERRRWEARFARYLMQSVLPLEKAVRQKKADPPVQEHGSAFRVAS